MIKRGPTPVDKSKVTAGMVESIRSSTLTPLFPGPHRTVTQIL
jgi:hypothetical protein